MNTLENLSDLKWKHRVLIIYDDLDENHLKKKIHHMSIYDKEIIDRDLIIIYDTAEEVYMNDQPLLESFKLSVKAITKQYQKKSMILIGKDGKTKKIFSLSDQISNVFDLIDKMPMRKFEIKKSIINLNSN
jgi:hypothetical protein